MHDQVLRREAVPTTRARRRGRLCAIAAVAATLPLGARGVRFRFGQRRRRSGPADQSAQDPRRHRSGRRLRPHGARGRPGRQGGRPRPQRAGHQPRGCRRHGRAEQAGQRQGRRRAAAAHGPRRGRCSGLEPVRRDAGEHHADRAPHPGVGHHRRQGRFRVQDARRPARRLEGQPAQVPDRQRLLAGRARPPGHRCSPPRPPASIRSRSTTSPSTAAASCSPPSSAARSRPASPASAR